MSGRKRSLSGPACFTPQKKKKYKCSYQDSWEKEFQWVKPSETISELPTYTSESDIELFWGEMAKIFDIFVQKKRFNVLCKVAKTLLVLPNSNADSERVFSLVKKIHTEFRYDLKNDTLCFIG